MSSTHFNGFLYPFSSPTQRPVNRRWWLRLGIPADLLLLLLTHCWSLRGGDRARSRSPSLKSYVVAKTQNCPFEALKAILSDCASGVVVIASHPTPCRPVDISASPSRQLATRRWLRFPFSSLYPFNVSPFLNKSISCRLLLPSVRHSINNIVLVYCYTTTTTTIHYGSRAGGG